MKDVVLLSEIHPLGSRMFNPLQQAMEWYGLLQAAEFEAASRDKISFSAAIALVAERCIDQGKILVLRDWNHLDFIGLPFVQPAYRPLLTESLQADFDLIRFASVRHPLDQWLSLTSNPVFANRLGVGKYLKSVRRFSEMAAATGFLHFEDFTADPDTALQQLCKALELPFDASYRDRWANYTNITGDVLPGRAQSSEIKPLPRQNTDPQLQQAFTVRADYPRILQMMNYTAGHQDRNRSL
ncbi:MAG: hypothetical protein SH820_03260 [Xanthomonadales bacterium]|nr:hypothetical protein [Xanthomonadales bacterium]